MEKGDPVDFPSRDFPATAMTQVAVEAADDTPRRAIRAMSCLKNWTMRRWIAIRNGENQWKWVKWGMALNNLRPYMIIDVL